MAKTSQPLHANRAAKSAPVPGAENLPDTRLNRTIPLILAVALFMENMDSTVIATSLPAIANDIGTSPVALKLALTSYLVSLAIFIPISGWMADRYGAKRVFRAAIGVFILGSIACAMSGSLVDFVLARFAQGLGGAMMTPVARLVLVRATPKRELVSAMAWLTVPALVGPLVGPPVGGFITTFFTWHWIFLINVPIGLVGIWLADRVLPDIAPAGARPIDVAGFLLSAIAASGVVFGLSVVSLPALPPIVGIATLVVGIAVGRRLCHGMRGAPPTRSSIRGSLPTRRSAPAIIGGTIFRIGNGAVPFLLPLMFQLGFGMTPFQSGMLTFASAFGAIMMKFLAPITLQARRLPQCADRGGASPARSSSASMAGSRRTTPIGGDHRRADRRRLPALAVLHLDQRAGVRRHRGQGRQPGDGDLGGVAADQRGARRRGRRHDPRRLHLLTGEPLGAAGLLDGLHDRRVDHCARGHSVPAARARRRQLGVRPRDPQPAEDSAAGAERRPSSETLQRLAIAVAVAAALAPCP